MAPSGGLYSTCRWRPITALNGLQNRGSSNQLRRAHKSLDNQLPGRRGNPALTWIS